MLILFVIGGLFVLSCIKKIQLRKGLLLPSEESPPFKLKIERTHPRLPIDFLEDRMFKHLPET